MAELVSGGSYVSAVMELAGYSMQADLLTAFQDFFQDAGAFIYTLAGVGAVVSVVTFGSFRSSRYLLIGPALFWFLVTPRFTFDGGKWQVGSGVARALHRQTGEGQSVNDVARGVKEAFGYEASNIRVAYAFALFVRPINTLVREVSGILLRDANGEQQEDKEYRTFLHRGRAFDAVTNARIRSPQLIQVLDENLKEDGCIDYTGYAMALGSPDLSPELLSRLQGNALSVANQRRQEYERRFNEMAEMSTTVSGTAKELFGLGQNANMKCKDLWKKTAELIARGDPPPPPNFVGPPAPGQNLGEAGRELKRIMGMATFDGAPAGLACQRLVEKFLVTRPGGGDCEEKLKAIIGMFMLKNTLLDRQALVRFSMSLHNKTISQAPRRGATMYNPVAHNSALTGMGGNPIETIEAIRPVMVPRAGWAGVWDRLRGGGVPLGGVYHSDPTTGNAQQQAAAARRWSSGDRLTVFGGANLASEASFVDFPRYNTRKLAQQMFTWALNAPWWQGVLLYLMAIIYPFLALVVIIPGRAASFLHLPMAWLWIKSWDIGFAMVLVLERTLWNNMPTMAIPNGDAKPLDQYDFMWQPLQHVEKVDPIWTIHGYYMLTSAALLAVPAITGAVTLKSRRAVLSSFTEKMLQDVRQAGDLGAGQVQIQAAAGRTQLMQELQTQAIRSMRAPGSGEAFRQFGATMYGLAAGAQSVIQNGFSGRNLLGRASWQVFMNGYIAAKSASLSMLEAQEAHDRAFATMHHPLYGRLGLYGKSMDADKAGADASGGFEIDGSSGGDRSVDAFIGLMQQRLTFMTTVPFQGTNPASQFLSHWGLNRAGLPAFFSDTFGGTGRDSPLSHTTDDIRLLQDEIQRRAELPRLTAEVERLQRRNLLDRDPTNNRIIETPVGRTIPAITAQIDAQTRRLDALNAAYAAGNPTGGPGWDHARIRLHQEDVSRIEGNLSQLRLLRHYQARLGGQIVRDMTHPDGSPQLDNKMRPVQDVITPALRSNPFPDNRPLAEQPLANLHSALADLQGTQQTQLAATRGQATAEWAHITNSQQITSILGHLPGAVNEMVDEQARGYCSVRGWNYDNLEPDQRREVDAFKERVRAELGNRNSPQFMNSFLWETFGLTPQTVQRSLEHRGTGHYNWGPENFLDIVSPTTPQNADYFGLPANIAVTPNPAMYMPDRGTDGPDVNQNQPFIFRSQRVPYLASPAGGRAATQLPPAFPQTHQHRPDLYPDITNWAPPGTYWKD